MPQLTSRSLSLALCRLEGKKKQVDIAQMSETVKWMRVYLRKQPVWEVVRWLLS